MSKKKIDNTEVNSDLGKNLKERRHFRCKDCREIFPESTVNKVFNSADITDVEFWCDKCIQDKAKD